MLDHKEGGIPMPPCTFAILEWRVQPTGGKMNQTDNQLTAPVDAKSEELMQEFAQHCEMVRQAHPEATDLDLIFQGWVIQKVAGLQVAVLRLAEQMEAMRLSTEAKP
jgi:hypothetical protein